MALRLSFFLACLLLTPLWSRAAEDLMDQYLSVPGSYAFVRRAPEGAAPGRVLMTVFEDFLCPACYRTATELIPSLKEKYRDRLEIRFVGYPFVHPESRLPARAYAIAQEMGLGEQMQQALFHARFEEQLNTASREGLAKVANSIGLAPELLLSRLDADGGSAEVERNLAQGDSYHLDAVPGIIFDGWIKVNELSQENLETIIDGLLAKKKSADGKAEKNVRTGGRSTP
ncbi:MAG: DsbA family protein [Deltaproteobacteria bacterium]|nr:DsbA family protein [Deltaproteobacteria bacterium]